MVSKFVLWRVTRFNVFYFKRLDTVCESNSILYPQEDVSQVLILVQKNLELRTLSMDESEDVWFIDVIGQLPKKIYDQMMLAKFLPKTALYELEQIPLSTSFEMKDYKIEIKGTTFDFI